MHRRRHAVLVVAALLGGGCAAGAPSDPSTSPPPSQRLDVRFLDDSGTATRGSTFVDVPVGAAVAARAPAWTWDMRADVCESDSSSLVLRAAGGGRTVAIGERCVWDGPGVPSPDGRFLAVWRHVDGAAARLHVLSLEGEPADLGEVRPSLSTMGTAVWTRDGRLWFAADAEAPGQGLLWSIAPPALDAVPTIVPHAAMIEAVGLAAGA